MVLVSLSERLVTGLPGIGAQFSTEKALPCTISTDIQMATQTADT